MFCILTHKREGYHEPLQLETTPSGVLGQISRRKEDLNRFIGKLRTQLAVREEQLRYHDELEEIVTSRVERSHEQDKVQSLWLRLSCCCMRHSR